MSLDSFWSGITGNPEEAFTGGFSLIPSKTLALAEIVTFKFVSDPNVEQHYEVKWRIIDGPYVKRVLFQKIKAFDQDQDKAKRAKNMLMMLLNMFNIDIPHMGAPSNPDLISFQGKIANIRIMIWKQGEKEGNWVSEVHPSDYVEAPALTGTIESAFSRNPKTTTGDFQL